MKSSIWGPGHGAESIRYCWHSGCGWEPSCGLQQQLHGQLIIVCQIILRYAFCILSHQQMLWEGVVGVWSWWCSFWMWISIITTKQSTNTHRRNQHGYFMTKMCNGYRFGRTVIMAIYLVLPYIRLTAPLVVIISLQPCQFFLLIIIAAPWYRTSQGQIRHFKNFQAAEIPDFGGWKPTIIERSPAALSARRCFRQSAPVADMPFINKHRYDHYGGLENSQTTLWRTITPFRGCCSKSCPGEAASIHKIWLILDEHFNPDVTIPVMLLSFQPSLTDKVPGNRVLCYNTWLWPRGPWAMQKFCYHQRKTCLWSKTSFFIGRYGSMTQLAIPCGTGITVEDVTSFAATSLRFVRGILHASRMHLWSLWVLRLRLWVSPCMGTWTRRNNVSNSVNWNDAGIFSLSRFKTSGPISYWVGLTKPPLKQLVFSGCQQLDPMRYVRDRYNMNILAEDSKRELNPCRRRAQLSLNNGKVDIAQALVCDTVLVLQMKSSRFFCYLWWWAILISKLV